MPLTHAACLAPAAGGQSRQPGCSVQASAGLLLRPALLPALPAHGREPGDQASSAVGLPLGLVWCGVVWCGVVWCGVVWCGVVWCGVVWCGVVWCACHAAQLAGGMRWLEARACTPASSAEPCRVVPCSLSPLSTPELPAPCTPHFLPLPSLPLLPSLLLRPVPSPRLPLAGFLWPRPSFMMPTYSMEHQAPGRACTTFRVRVGTANAAAGLSAGLPAAPVVFAARRCWPTIDSCDVAPILPCVLQPTAWLPGSAKRWGAARWLGWTKSCGSR
jgi:hypothetical protein